MNYIKKPVIVDAFQLNAIGLVQEDWFWNAVSEGAIHTYCFGRYNSEDAYCDIETLEGTMRAYTGDYIIRGVNGEIYPCKSDVFNKTYEIADNIESEEQKSCKDMGEISDGYHTFNELYYQRAVLFATIVNLNKDKAWKSFKHFDGKYCFDSNGYWFIVGIDTPEGSYTYHYSKEYWDIFDCEELECGKEWDGHTENDVTRLLSLTESEG